MPTRLLLFCPRTLTAHSKYNKQARSKKFPIQDKETRFLVRQPWPEFPGFPPAPAKSLRITEFQKSPRFGNEDETLVDGVQLANQLQNAVFKRETPFQTTHHTCEIVGCAIR